MTLPQAYEIFEYWQNWPPEHESLAIFLQCYTTWEPGNAQPRNEAEQRESLERRWKQGAMSPKQLFEMMGGNGKLGQGVDPKSFPGIGPFPGL